MIHRQGGSAICLGGFSDFQVEWAAFNPQSPFMEGIESQQSFAVMMQGCYQIYLFGIVAWNLTQDVVPW